MAQTVKSLGYGPPEERAANMLIEGNNLQAMTTLYRYREGHITDDVVADCLRDVHAHLVEARGPPLTPLSWVRLDTRRGGRRRAERPGRPLVGGQ